MIRHGKVALFCSREFQLGERTAYGGGFLWRLTDNNICVSMFWVTREPLVPIRLHLFGDTPDAKIGKLAIEVNAPESLRVAAQDILHRVPIVFEYESIVDYNNDFNFFEDEEINIEQINTD